MKDTQEENSENSLPRSIGNPATQALNGFGITRLDQLTKVTEAEVARLHGVGPKAVRILREALAEKGMSFAEKERKT